MDGAVRKEYLHSAMKTSIPLRGLAAAFLFATAGLNHATSQIASNELFAPKIEMASGNIEFTVESSVSGRRYQLQQSETLLPGSWVAVGGESVGNGGLHVVKIPHESGTPRRFYRFALDTITPLGTMVFIPGGTFQMGNALSASGDGYSNELPVHSVYISGFYLQNTKVTKAQWAAVLAWGSKNGYLNLPIGSGKADNHPVHSID